MSVGLVSLQPVDGVWKVESVCLHVEQTDGPFPWWHSLLENTCWRLWASTSYPCPLTCWHHRGKISVLRRVWCRGVLVQRCWVGTVLYSNFVRFGTISTLVIFVHHFRISKCEASFLRSWEWYVFASKYGCWVGFHFCKKKLDTIEAYIIVLF